MGAQRVTGTASQTPDDQTSTNPPSEIDSNKNDSQNEEKTVDFKDYLVRNFLWPLGERNITHIYSVFSHMHHHGIW